MFTSRRQRALAIPIVGVAALALAACSSTTSTGSVVSPGAATSTNAGTTSATTTISSAPSTTSVHNAADVTFATDMIPHHEQAVVMAKLATTRASSAAVKDLARKIEAAQQPEITMMAGWLTAWGQPQPAQMGGMDMGGSTGMMSTADMMKLTNSTGMAYDKMFLTMMISHHQGALTMAATETASGQSADALTLATNITTSQTAEIKTMEGLLANG